MNCRDRSGLSLLELLVALVLVAIIAGGLATSTSFGVQLLDRTQNLSQTSSQLALRNRLRHWMTTAVPPTLFATFETAFVGDAQRVTFTTLAPAPFAPQSAALRITVDGSKSSVLLTIDEIDDTGRVLASHSRSLAFGAQNMNISYLSDDPNAPGWRNTWNDANRLPILIQITADQGSTPEWPDFVIEPVYAQKR